MRRNSAFINIAPRHHRSRCDPLKDAAGFVEAEARVTRKQLAGIAVTEIAEEIGLPFAVRKEFGIDPLLVESGHRPAIETQGPRCEHQVSALHGAVAERRFMNQGGIPGEYRSHIP